MKRRRRWRKRMRRKTTRKKKLKLKSHANTHTTKTTLACAVMRDLGPDRVKTQNSNYFPARATAITHTHTRACTYEVVVPNESIRSTMRSGSEPSLLLRYLLMLYS